MDFLKLISNEIIFRVRHYGEGDKVPRHKYGIYSIEWPKEKERLIEAARKRKEQWALSGHEPAKEKKRQVQSANSRCTRYHEFPKKKILQNQDQEFKNISRMLSRALPQPVVQIKTVCSTQDENKRKALMDMRYSRIRSGDGGDGRMKNRAASVYGNVAQKRKGEEQSDAGQTQGDHLNQIKALKKMNPKGSYVSSYQRKQYSYPVQKRNVGVGC